MNSGVFEVSSSSVRPSDGRPIRRHFEEDPRSLERLKAHYDLEVMLADRLRQAPAVDRLRLYGEVYDELFAKLPDHYQFHLRDNGDATRINRKFRSLRPFLSADTDFLEIGAGDCQLSSRVASTVRSVIAVDVSEMVADLRDAPPNLSFVLSDGISIPIPAGSVDVVCSNDLMEHLHPDDAFTQLRNILAVLRPGGRYVCSTPNRITGPHDVSAMYDDVARGFHLKEYTSSDLREVLLRAGFRKVRFHVAIAGVPVGYNPCPGALEWLVEVSRKHLGIRLTRFRSVRALLRLRAVAIK